MTSFLSLIPHLLLGHPGHGTIPADTPSHYFFEPVHAIWGLPVLGLVLAAAILTRRCMRGSPLRSAPVPVRKR